jgi:hypothetical protein
VRPRVGSSTAAAATLALGALLASTGCGGDGDADPAAEGASFLAFASAFEGFRTWPSTPLSGEPIAESPHTSGPRVVYVNRAPAAGSTAFPVGTVIVKELAGTAADPPKIFAMVKRGAGFNSAGAAGWEWFELQAASAAPESPVAIVWRGVGPPLGEMYGGDPNGGCNGCHTGARATDFVQTPGLALSSFQ